MPDTVANIDLFRQQTVFIEQIGRFLLTVGGLFIDGHNSGWRTMIQIADEHGVRQAHGFRQKHDTLLALTQGQRIGLAEGIQNALYKCAVFLNIGARSQIEGACLLQIGTVFQYPYAALQQGC